MRGGTANRAVQLGGPGHADATGPTYNSLCRCWPGRAALWAHYTVTWPDSLSCTALLVCFCRVPRPARRELAEESGIEHWGRVPALNTNATFIDDLADAVTEALPYVGSLQQRAAAGAASISGGDSLVPLGECECVCGMGRRLPRGGWCDCHCAAYFAAFVCRRLNMLPFCTSSPCLFASVRAEAVVSWLMRLP